MQVCLGVREKRSTCIVYEHLLSARAIVGVDSCDCSVRDVLLFDLIRFYSTDPQLVANGLFLCRFII